MKTMMIVFLALLITACSGSNQSESNTAEAADNGSKTPDTLTVYSARKEYLIKPLIEVYENKTGIKIRLHTDKAGALLERLKSEGQNTPADLLITVDAGNLWHAANAGLLRSVRSEQLERDIPGHLRDPDGRWYGLSVRARTLVYNPEKVEAGELTDYAGLADERWKGHLCLRTSKKVYNQSLVAMLIAKHGVARTEEIIRGWVANLATSVFSDDTAVLKAVAAGQCAVGVVNTYYVGRLQKESPDLPLKLHWPPETHVNVSGAGVTRYAKHADAAKAFLVWLASREAQQDFASVNLEYPANPAVTVDPFVAAWGEYTASPLNLVYAGELQAQAVKLMDRAGYR